jgi:PIN domain nuclease of toxin-antitoxin system
VTERPPIVLDASALLALLREEPGADAVERVLDGSVMSCVNLAEVLRKAEQHDVDVEGLEYDLEALGVRFAPFDTPAARSSAELWGSGRGLSLGDRACLALATSIDGVALTADHRWADAGVDVRVEPIR